MSNFVGIPTPTTDAASLREALLAVIEQLQVLTGERGSPLDRAATLEDLVRLGLVRTTAAGVPIIDGTV